MRILPVNLSRFSITFLLCVSYGLQHAQTFGTPELVHPGVLDAIYYDGAIGANPNTYTAVGSYKNYLYVESPVISAGGRDIILSSAGTAAPNGFTITAGGKLDDEAFDYMVTSSNIYICGYFNDTARFGSTNVISRGGKDAFVACFTTAGVFSWVRAFGTTGDDWATTLNNGNPSSQILISVNYSGTLIAGPDTLPCSGGSDAAVINVSSSGTVLSADKLYGGPGDDIVNYCTAWGTTSYHACGSFSDSLVFGSDTITSNGGTDFITVFIDVVSSSGWSYSNGGSGDDEAIEYYVGSSGLSVVGNFEQNWTEGSSTLISNGMQDCFHFTLVTATGAPLGGFSFGGTGQDSITSVFKDAFLNELAFAGKFEGTMVLGSATLISSGLSDGFLALFSTGGSPISAQRFGRAGEDAIMGATYSSSNGNLIAWGYESTLSVPYPVNYPYEHERSPIVNKYSSISYGFMTGLPNPWSSTVEIDCDRDAAGNFYVAADFTGVVTFDSVTIKSNGNAVLAKYDPQGNLIWIRVSQDIADVSQTSTPSSRAVLVETNDLGYTYVVGYFQSKCTFGSTQLIPLYENNNGDCDAFLVCYDPNGAVLFAKRIASSANQVKLNDLEVNRNHQVLVTGRWGSGLLQLEGSQTMTNSSAFNSYVLRYSMIGNLSWSQRIASTSAETFIIGSTIDNSNCIYVLGSYKGSALTDLSLTSNNPAYHNTYIVKYSGTGQIVWTHNIQSTTQSFQPYGDIIYDSLAGLYICGPFTNTVNLPNGDQYPCTSTTDVDNWLARVDTSGGFLWTFQVANTGSFTNHIQYSLTSNNMGKGMITFCYMDSLEINGIPMTNFTSVREGFYTFDLNKNTKESYSEPENGIYRLYARRDQRGVINFHGLLSATTSTFAQDTLYSKPNHEAFFVEFLDTCGAAQFNYSESGGNFQFSNLSYGYDSIIWSFGDGNYSSLQNPTHIYSTTGTFIVTLVTFTDCGADTSTALVVWNPLNIRETLLKISVFPNPTHDILNISSDNLISDVRVYDGQGKLLQETRNINALAYSCDISFYTEGMLIIEVMTETNQFEFLRIYRIN